MHRPSPARHLALAPRVAVALAVGVALALGALGCEDGANSKIGAGGSIDTGVVDPNRGDNRPPMDAGVPDDGVFDAGAADGPPTARPDRGNDGDHLDGDVGGADGGEGSPDMADDRPCVVGATRPCDVCADAFETCEFGAWGPCEAPAEVCNGADDDCDGRVDELFAVGEPCTAGLGLCAAEGATVCDGPGAVRCDATPGPPEEEGCNTLDDDCDGTIDEDFGGGVPCVLGLGRCAVPSVTACLGEATFCLGEAEAPIDERCNGVDDDCDGITDEDFDLGADCEIGEGLCRAPGIRVCAADGGGLCAADGIEPRDERCDGLDDDCDGTVDEGFGDVGPCFEGVGACRRQGRVICDAAGEFRCSVGPGAPGGETCNGVDDDCDGSTDEGLGVGAVCTVGAGGCARAGVTICAADGTVRCPAEEGAPSAETCDGIDDDCDGDVDEDYRVGERCEVGVGACNAGGAFACDGAGGVACDAPVIAPVDESCDGADDDCDGMIDEGFGVGDRCVGGDGACARDGRVACVGDGTAACGAEEGQPAFEVCNGVDDDCDGDVDEDLGLGSPCAEGIGACARPGARVCADDGGVVCDAAPGARSDETCNGIDDDCDGSADEGITLGGVPLGGACEAGVGICRAVGRVVCGGGRARCDAAPGAPEVERCDGLDDDCDGRTDEGFDLNAACSVGVGACVRNGQRICRGDVGVCSATPGAPAGELCNEIDDDCDGRVDEGLTLDGAALGDRCEVGLGRCLAGGEVVCDGVAPVCDARPGEPRPESCNMLDDDCDGEIDDGLGLGDRCERGVGACVRAGILICEGGGGTECTARAGEPRDERCDATDDDCDGAVDEDFELGAACTSGIGACAVAGVTVCAPAGDRARCGAVPGPPVAERCNDIDDDCDGRVDEGLALDGVPYGGPCSAGLGACFVGGVVVCAADGGLECDAQPGMPAPAEACDAIDDDCDGRVDEGYAVGDDCISGLGICAAEGSRICSDDGTGTCDARPGRPEVEVCDDLDNDCDGIVDEGEGDQAGVAFGLCGPRYRSCLDALRAGGVESGVYRVSSIDAAGREVYCDQETDGGGWTLVLASNAAPVDGLGVWHGDLLDTSPAGEHPGVWAGLGHLGERPFDLRFACRSRDVGAGDDGGGYDVDVSFYGTPWYRGFLRGGEAVSCFATGAGDPVLPARRDNRGGGVRAHGQPYPAATGGRLVGERACESSDFSIDFDDGALAGARLDGTDWGSRGGRGVCGVDSPRGQWLVFAREDVPHPLGPVGLIGLPRLAEPLEAAGFEPIVLDVDDPDLGDRLDPEVLPAVFIGRYAHDWDAVPASLRNHLGCYTLDGGSLVTEFDGFALLGTRYADDFAYADDAPDPWAWLPAVSGGGSARAIDTPVFISDSVDPITRGLGEQLLAGEGTERFLTIGRVHPTVPTLLSTLARFPGNGGTFPEASYPALLRGNQCGGSLLVGTFDYADTPRDPGVARLVGNLGAAAVSPPDTTLDDICRRGLGAGRCVRLVP